MNQALINRNLKLLDIHVFFHTTGNNCCCLTFSVTDNVSVNNLRGSGTITASTLKAFSFVIHVHCVYTVESRGAACGETRRENHYHRVASD